MMGKKPFSLIIIIFFLINILLFFFKNQLQDWAVDYNVVIAGNLVLFLATLFSFFLFSKGLQSKNTAAFLRMTYGGMMLKMGICIAAVVIYALVSRGKMSRVAIFACFGFYLVYTFAEVSMLIRLSKQQKNA